MDQKHSAAGMVRAAETMLRYLGGTAVILRVPSAAQNETGLGLNGPALFDYQLAPAVIRPLEAAQGRARVEVLLAPGSLEQQLGLTDAAAVEAYCSQALGFVLQGRLFRITNILADQFAGEPFLFHFVCTE